MIAMDEKRETEYLTPEQVARRLNVKERHVLEMLREGTIVGVKVGRLWRISPEEFEAFLKRNQSK